MMSWILRMAYSAAGQLWREARGALGAGVVGFHLKTTRARSSLYILTWPRPPACRQTGSASTIEISSMTSRL